MDHQNTLTTCANCLHKTSNGADKQICLVSGKPVETGDSCENFSQNKRDSQEIAQFGYEAEKEYFSTKLYNLFAAYVIGIILGGIFLFIGYSTNPQEHVVMIVVSVLVVVTAAIVSMVLLYNLWRFIISELKKHGLTPSVETPGKAVGYLFIPFFNFYWIFMGLGKLPVDLNRIAMARTGKKIMSNEIGIILCITTLLSIIPVVGTVLALVNMVLTPVFFILVINGVRNIPYSSGTEIIEKKQPAEPLDINDIRDYSQMFDKEKYGINFEFGLYYFVAVLCTQIIANVAYFISMDVPFRYYFNIGSLSSMILLPLIYSVMLVIFSHAIRKKIWLAFLWGLTHVVIGVVPFLILMINGSDNQYIFSKSFLTQMLTNFFSAVIFIISISTFLRFYGVKFWSILLAILSSAVITHSFFYTTAYFLEGKFDFKVIILVGLTSHIVLSSIAIYFAFYQYIQRTKKVEAKTTSLG